MLDLSSLGDLDLVDILTYLSPRQRRLDGNTVVRKAVASSVNDVSSGWAG